MVNKNEISIPANNKVLLKWSAMRIEKADNYDKAFNVVRTPLTALVKKDGYTQFKDRLNWLYNNYTKENYLTVWSEIDQVNQRRIQQYVFEAATNRADYIMSKQVKEAVYHLGEIPEWIKNLNEDKHKLLLDRAITCYGLEVEQFVFETKTLYTLPERVIKDINDYGELTYYTSEELAKDPNYHHRVYNDVLGKIKLTNARVQLIAEQAVIRDAWIMSKLEKASGINLHECREVEGDDNHNIMEPITDLQGPESPYGLDVELRDFQYDSDDIYD